MTETLSNPILSVLCTTGTKVKELSIKDGQLIFVRDKSRVALDFGGKRTFYNQIEELSTEQDRTSILAPVNGQFYFVIGTAVLWTYNNGWIQITTSPEEIVFIGTELPELGSEKTLYVNKEKKEISVWDNTSSSYVVVANKTEEVGIEYIDALFNK